MNKKKKEEGGFTF